MLIFTKQDDLKQHLDLNANQKKIGFVPTMGALHQGHMSLLKASLSDNECTVISIFVNPTQFNNSGDLEKYPRSLEADIKKIASCSDEIIVYAPDVFDIYGENPQSEIFDFDGLEHQMEGQHRPGHFDGVGTIVKKLFEIVNPTNAYFGEKDFQQLQIIKKLVEKQKMLVNIIQVPIFREDNGLAMSSRNERLSKDDKENACYIFKSLKSLKVLFNKYSAKSIKKMIMEDFKKHPEFKLEYIEIADEETLLPCTIKLKNRKYRAFMAVNVGNVRLIDTLLLN